MSQFPILQLLPKKERAVLHRHPWVFSGAVKKLPQAANGDIVEVQSAEGQTLAYGFFSPQSQIVCRLFEFMEPAWGQGMAASAAFFGQGQVGPDYWRGKIEHALALRRRLLDPATTNCYRLLHAEGDFFPGVIADVYHQTVVLQLLIKGTEKLLPTLTELLLGLGYRHIYLKSKASSHFLEDMPQESRWLTEAPELPLRVREHGLEFYVNPEKGQKTGFFIDQRENRQLLRGLAHGKRVLNTFSYTAGFSVYALAGGASLVHSVDISKDAVALGQANLELNRGQWPAQIPHQGIAADCFEYLRQTDERYDLIVLDPPAFAKNAKSVPNAARGYKDLNLLAFRQIEPGGLVMTFSCSQNIDKLLFQKIVFGAAADARRNVRILQFLGQPADHPVNIFHPESEYLKGLLLWVE
ncbi:MAG: class I SAM-dependent rRNA methyltransferase [Bernardetiaceae bacterium]|nr:class I SAM-dependent rRNA methyltransferase [Bernardetiaceae bacterium]